MPNPIEVRIAEEQDNEFFYLGYSRFPGKDAVQRSLANPQRYSPHKLHSIDSQGLTIDWQQSTFGFTPKERRQTFYKYAADIVVPRLEETLHEAVIFEPDMPIVRLQITDIIRTDGPEGLKVVRRQLGSMSLFVAKVELSEAVEQYEEA